MNTLDIVILVIFVASVAIGYWRGVIVQAGSIGAVVAGIVLCRLGGMWLATRLAGADGVDYLDRVLACVILFVAGYAGVWFLSRLIKRITHALALGVVDRLAGALFSLFEWMLVLSLALNFWLVVKPETDYGAMSALAGGKAVAFVVKLAPAVLGCLH
ncbi:MAG: CvpA family protein [Muribaculaceae bacterium]|nr:CvpA family protein [Muribaculaceae bacterium]